MPATTRTQAVSPGYIYTVTASSEAIVRDVETDKLLCKANNGSQGMFVAIGGTVSITTSDPTATITQASTNSGGARFEVHQTRPDTGEEGVIYLIPITSSTEEENEYEEWIWVKGEWERLGTTGVNLSNYATLTDANTYSGNNTFNGLLLKSNSSSLGDTSVLNRSEADARYGRLDANNTWSGAQYIGANGSLTLHPDSTIVAPRSIRGSDNVTWVSFNGLHLVGIADIEASDVKTPIVTTNVLYTIDITNNKGDDVKVNDNLRIQNTLYVDSIQANTSNAIINLSDVRELRFGNPVDGAVLSGVQYLKYADTLVNLGFNGDIEITSAGLRLVNQGSWLEFNQGTISGVAALRTNGTNLLLERSRAKLDTDLWLIHSHGLFASHISGVKSLTNDTVTIKYNEPSIPAINNAVGVAAPEGIKVTASTNNLYSPEVTISPSKIEAFQLNAASFGSGKYGLRLTPDSCQLYGIDFAYGDAWSSYPVDGVAPAILSSDTVKIMKPALTLDTTGVASLAFGGAPKVLFRTFTEATPAIFEFQAGHWSDDSHSAIVTGMVDLRKPSLDTTALHTNSLINKNELESLILVKTDSDGNIAIGDDAQIAAGSGSIAIGVGSQSEYAGVAIGPLAQASGESIAIGNYVYSEHIAIGHNTYAYAAGIAIGSNTEAKVGELNITVGGHHLDNQGARCTMLLYGGTSYSDRDTTGYLTFEIGDTLYNEKESDPDTHIDSITISKPNLWSALDRAKYRGAQPYASYAASAVSNIPALEPNSITHIYTATEAAIDLSDITLAQHDTAVTTAELWVEVTTAGATITWPDDMLWPDEADPATAPSFTGPEDTTEAGYTMQRLYCVTLRTQPIVNISTGNAGTPLLIATVAYTLDHKVPVSGS